MLKIDLCELLKEPLMPKFSVSLFMPSLAKLRLMADKLKTMSKHLIVRGNTNGSLQLRSKSSTMKVSVNFVECERPEWGDPSLQSNSDRFEFFFISQDKNVIFQFFSAGLII